MTKLAAKGYEGMRAQIEREKQTIELLTEIRNLLKGTAPIAPGAPVLPGIPLSNIQLQKILEAAMINYGILQRANDFYVDTIDLSVARSTPTELTELENAMALTIFTNTGTFNLLLQKKTDTRTLTINSLTWPQTLLIDWFDIKGVWITNTAQPGLNTTIIKFFRA